MIDQVTAQGFKGLTFTQDLDRLNIILGLNGTGKSARTQALILALLGYIPGSAKKNEDILENYGAGNKLVVGFKIGNDTFERGFVRTEKGVSQGFKVNGKKSSKDVFMHYLGSVGTPSAIDIGAFMELSDQKKIDLVFDLYPPESDIKNIAADIEKAKEKKNLLTQKAEASEAAAARLATSRAAMEMPVGSLAELQAQEKLLNDQLAKAQEDIKEAEIEEAKLKATADEKARADKEAKDTADKKLTDDALEASKKKLDSLLERESQRAPTDEAKTSATPFASPGIHIAPELGSGKLTLFKTETVADSIQAILDAINSAGCSGCAARLVAIRELKKYRRLAA
jgi:hypothetical protein